MPNSPISPNAPAPIVSIPAVRRPSAPIFNPEFDFAAAHANYTSSPASDMVEPLTTPRRSPQPIRGRTLDATPGPIPPSLRSRLLVPAPTRPLALTLLPMPMVTPLTSPSLATEARAPSPLPPPLQAAIPTEIQEMTDRLSRLVAQSNQYVRGLAQRIEVLERHKSSFEGPATLENLKVFLEAHLAFAGLNAERIVTFKLPLYVWQRLSEQILRDHNPPGKSLESVLYWRARAEAEAMGLLANDRRGSTDSAYSGGAQSIFTESRRGSIGTGDLCLPPRRPSVNTSRSFSSTTSDVSGGGSRRPSGG